MSGPQLFEGAIQAHVRLWLTGCRWAFAAGLLVALVAVWHASDRGQPLQVTPERINPNTAPAASLVRLPGIGKVRALEIIAYRQTAQGQAFDSAASLEKIRGIGPKTSEALRGWLVFE